LSIALLIFAATIVVSLVAFRVPRLVERYVFRPYWFLRRRQYETLVTNGFLHGNLGHLLFNMITYWFFAFPLERRIGSAAFAALYLIGLLLSNVGTWRKHRDEPEYATLGASGAIMAVLFAYIVYYPEHRIFIFPIPLPIPAPLFAVLFAAYSWYSARQAHGRINHDAHLDGALVGLVFVALTDREAFSGLLRTVF
jgi:membrane associated rhomboid family serine protease